MADMFDLRLATIAANRFGFGAKPGELSAIAPDPRGWLKQQLTPDPAAVQGTPSARLLGELLATRKAHKGDMDALKAYDKTLRENFRTTAAERTLAAAGSTAPFRERLVQFWSNHFTVSVQRGVVIPIVLGFENEAIRPHVMGRFRDMLLAVAQHPAMLMYLDNGQSVGPNSPAGLKRDRGLNENLAREMLELHTVGVDGGYSQTDVTEFAKVLTGWSISRDNDPDPGFFHWRPMIHEPGVKTVLGRAYREDGQDEATAVMDDLVSRPATARHIATRLARHFVSDDPPQAAIERLAETFQKSGGDLHAVSMALTELPQIWSQPMTKVRTPNDLVIAACRAFGIADEETGRPVLIGLKQMGQVPFEALSPAGWPDTAEGWVSPEAMMTRIDWALSVGQKLNGRADAREVAKETIQPIAGDSTIAHIHNAPSPAEALALLIASPEFQRR